jgi:HPt (histidine-containing phosphotransfer) domain-containing protein
VTDPSAILIGLERIKLRFLSLLDDRLDELELQIDDIALPHRRAHALSRVQAEAHKIAGTASVVGFSELGRIAAVVDSSIEKMSTSEYDEKTIGQIQAQVDQLIEIGVLAIRSQPATT